MATKPEADKRGAEGSALNRRIILLCAAMLAALTFIILTAGIVTERRNEALGLPETMPVAAGLEVPAEDYKYLIREFNGKICVFHTQYPDIPSLITDIDPETLGRHDRISMRRGMYIVEREDVLRMLEDLNS